MLPHNDPKKQLRVAPLRRRQETRSEATKFRTAELVAPGFVMVQKSVNGAGAKCKNHDNLSRTAGSLLIIPSVLALAIY